MNIPNDAPAIGAAADSLFEMWQSYREILEACKIPAQAIEQTRHGFYAGAAAMFYAILNGGGELTEADAVARLERLRGELHAFKYDIRGGTTGG